MKQEKIGVGLANGEVSGRLRHMDVSLEANGFQVSKPVSSVSFPIAPSRNVNNLGKYGVLRP